MANGDGKIFFPSPYLDFGQPGAFFANCQDPTSLIDDLQAVITSAHTHTLDLPLKIVVVASTTNLLPFMFFKYKSKAGLVLLLKVALFYPKKISSYINALSVQLFIQTHP